jgi:hypothetical protein
MDLDLLAGYYNSNIIIIIIIIIIIVFLLLPFLLEHRASVKRFCFTSVS